MSTLFFSNWENGNGKVKRENWVSNKRYCIFITMSTGPQSK